MELTAAYAAIANGGTYTEPILYTEVLDHDGNVLLDRSEPDTREVLKDSTAYLLTSAMENVISQGTGTAAELDNMHAAGKTGTTQNSTDLWLAAYTPYYTASVWGGYDSNKPMENMSQSWHEQLWKNIMDRIHEGLEDKDFEMPSSVRECAICSETGLLAGSGCPSYTEYFSKDNIPTRQCSGHNNASADPEEETVAEDNQQTDIEEQSGDIQESDDDTDVTEDQDKENGREEESDPAENPDTAQESGPTDGQDAGG